MTTQNHNIQFYDTHAQTFAEQYNSVSFEDVHQSWKPFWPLTNDLVLDIGAGSGRDALWMSNSGCTVYAVEPAENLRKLGQAKTGEQVAWFDDRLPSLDKISNLGLRFNVILVSAVWMHIPPSYRSRAFRKLANLLTPNGKLIFTLRYGEFPDGRTCHPISVEELNELAKDQALHQLLPAEKIPDSLGRKGVYWQTLAFNLPDDGTGDLIKIRHIIVNDSKSATYKLALLRTLLRIADTHSGCILDRSDTQVAIPLGLVALYWIKAFKRVLDVGELQQNSNPNLGLGFVKENGWNKIKHIGADDLSIGSLFVGDEALAIQQTISDTIKTMKDGPIKYIYIGNDKTNTYFSTEPAKKRAKKSKQIVLDLDFLSSYGHFVLDETLWECLRLYNAWIEPLVVNQWINEMRSYKSNREREATGQIDLQTYHNCLIWLDAEHDTRLVREKIAKLQEQKIPIESVWSGRPLNQAYHIDHCLPFAYWPNNDRWNLLPTTPVENEKKKAKLPSKELLTSSKARVLNWWDIAWNDSSEKKQFFTQASLSLPNIPSQCQDLEEVFAAMEIQILSVKKRLLIPEWEFGRVSLS